MKARDVVMAHIAAQARRFPHLSIEPMVTVSLDRREAALAAAIDHAVIQRWLTLAAVVQSRLSRPWDRVEPHVQAALLVGAAQLLLMDKLPDHAVINETVEWVRRCVANRSQAARTAKSAGLVNAVLRRVAELRVEKTPATGAEPTAAHDEHSNDALQLTRRTLPLEDGRTWRLAEDIFDESPALRLAQQTSHPAELIAHWMSILGEPATIALAMHNIVHPPIIMHDACITASVEVAASPGTDAQLNALPDPALLDSPQQPHDQPGFFTFRGDKDQLHAILRANGNMIVQDPMSAEPVMTAGGAAAGFVREPRVIIDVCAGRGTKTRQLAAAFPNARIIASDIDPARMRDLEAFASPPPLESAPPSLESAQPDQPDDQPRNESARHARIETIPHDRLREFDNQADLLLLDVPCSNTGVLARRPHARYRFTAAAMKRLVDLQRQIIADAIPLLAPSGRLLYSTCSVEPAENQQQAAWIARWHPLRMMHNQARLPAGLPGDQPAQYRDGGYFAILTR